MRDPKRYENLERMVFDGVGEYGIPTLEPVDFDGDTEFIPFNFAATSKDREKKSIHFFIDDYQFIRLWNDPDRYIPMLRQFQYVFTPDFSLYTDFPKAVQIFNHYRKHWIGAYMQMYGVKVIPKAYKADRKATNDFLNQADGSMGGTRGDQRRATRGRRGGRRGI